jgi:MSHA biogenesis protein MshI
VHSLNSLLGRFKKSKQDVNIGISFQTGGVSVCVTEPDANGLKVSLCVSLKGEKTHQQLLAELIKKHSIPKGKVIFVLNADQRTIHKLARPVVEGSELKQSVSYLLKDRLVHGIENSVVDIIDYPEGCQLDDQLMVVECSRKLIKNAVDVITELGFELHAIDISALLLGEILQSYPGIDKGLALVLDHEDGATLMVYRGESLYLIRKLSGITDFIACLPSESNMMMTDMLLLEIQRTLDYYDAQMRQPPLAGILLSPSFADISPLAEYLDKNLAIKVECLDINNLLDLPEPLSPAMQQDCLTACAAAFRREPRS